jgi:fused signal recognition particle receptor
VARDWTDLFITGEPAPTGSGDGDAEERRSGFFRRLRENLGKTRKALTAEVQATLGENLDEETW